ncbi:hypothetical protein J8I87_29760 [Paraburkholderia sp. LEh10]|uniref:hypothetical protein n=1 Tax=Paraburkholderia sp. LEh10 TaxID=2821353 RepID=UPI001AE65B20|nr:hypothetical protein [Paraburkholderia sp. LEh10]MBP0593800.1 hypothetical protein [Paraburkholderia sp. LEh10]
MNEQLVSDQGLMLQWLFGGAVVCFYAFRRFESPGPTRATTTFWQYWLAKTGYAGSMLLLFIVLGGAGTDLPRQILDFLQISAAIKMADQPPGPLLAALILTSLLPNAPLLQRFDELIKVWFQRVGNIPFEVRELSQRLKDSIFRPSKDRLLRMCSDIKEAGIDPEWLDAPQGSLAQIWACTAALYMTIKTGAMPKGFLRFADSRKDVRAEIDRRFESLQSVEPGVLVQLDDAKSSALAKHLERKVRKDIDDLHEMLCDYISAGVLETEWTFAQRHARLVGMGFRDLDKPRHVLGSHEVVLITGLIFLAMMFVSLATRRFFEPTPLGQNFRTAVLVSIIYGIAIVVAIYPKAIWSFADIVRVGTRPVAAYVASAFVAVVAAFFVSLLFRFVFDQSGNLFQTISTPGAFRRAFEVSVQRSPWLVTTFIATIAIAWTADNRAGSVENVPAWLRAVESIGMCLVFVAAQWITFALLEASTPDFAAKLSQPKLLLTAAIIGVVVGGLVPHLYRRSKLHLPKAVPESVQGNPAL